MENQQNPSMRDLQGQVPNRMDQEGEPVDSPRLAQGRAPQEQSGAEPKSGNLKWLAWLAGGVTVGSMAGTLYFIA